MSASPVSASLKSSDRQPAAWAPDCAIAPIAPVLAAQALCPGSNIPTWDAPTLRVKGASPPVCCWLHSAHVYMVLQPAAQLPERPLVHVLEEQQAGPGVEPEAVQLDGLAPATHLQAVRRAVRIPFSALITWLVADCCQMLAWLFCSSRVTSKPRWARRAATTRPATPPPRTIVLCDVLGLAAQAVDAAVRRDGKRHRWTA
jgi:hypothetical protein